MAVTSSAAPTSHPRTCRRTGCSPQLVLPRIHSDPNLGCLLWKWFVTSLCLVPPCTVLVVRRQKLRNPSHIALIHADAGRSGATGGDGGGEVCGLCPKASHDRRPFGRRAPRLAPANVPPTAPTRLLPSWMLTTLYDCMPCRCAHGADAQSRRRRRRLCASWRWAPFAASRPAATTTGRRCVPATTHSTSACTSSTTRPSTRSCTCRTRVSTWAAQRRWPRYVVDGPRVVIRGRPATPRQPLSLQIADGADVALHFYSFQLLFGGSGRVDAVAYVRVRERVDDCTSQPCAGHVPVHLRQPRELRRRQRRVHPRHESLSKQWCVSLRLGGGQQVPCGNPWGGASLGR